MSVDTPAELNLENPDFSSTEPLIEKSGSSMRTSKVRWIALLLACFVNFGPFFCFDNPGALMKYMKQDLHVESDSIDLLYSVYSMPNIILPFIGGVIMDKIGIRICIILFASLVIVGQVVCTIGAYQHSFTLLVIGRVLFGLGGESLTVSQSSITAKWFMGKELAFSMGATLCVSRLGSSLNSFLSPTIYNAADQELGAPFLVGAGLCVVSLIGTVVLTLIDKKADEQEGSANKDQEKADTIKIQDFKNLSLLFYLLLFNCFFLYGAFFGLNNNLNDMMSTRFGFDPQSAGLFIPIVYLCSAVITPIFGMFTDKNGRRVLFMFIAAIIFLIDNLIIAFLNDAPEGSPNYGMLGVLLGIGLFYSTYAAVFWPCVPLVVQEKLTGTAYGIITALQNLMLAIIPLAIGGIQKSTKNFHGGYFWTQILLAILVAIGIVITGWMYFEDMKKGGKLNKAGSGKDSIRKSRVRSFVN